MIEGLKPYAGTDAIKRTVRTSEVNIPWLNSIPEHWTIVRSKRLFTARKERAHSDDVQLSATQAYGVIPQKDFESRVGRRVVRITQHLEKRAHVEKDDFVISMRSFQGGLERAWATGCIRSSYVVLKPSLEARVDYFAHLFKSLDYIRALQATSNFIRDGQDLNFGNFCLVDLPLPPQDEQAAIARFLDHANRKIDGFIRAKRKLIGLLDEQKQVIIHQAVTRGLHPDVELKASGIPWLGDIPAHWEARQLRRVCRRIKTGGTPKGADEKFFEKGGFNWHTPSDFRDAIELGDASRQLSKLGVKEVNAFPADTILMIGIGATIGKVSISRRACSCNQQINAILPNPKLVHLEYLAFYLRTLRGFIVDCGKFTTMPIINQDKTKRLPVLVPPIMEQVQIAKHIDLATKPFSTAITRTELEIALVQEYRTCLTADIVTGKLDVREAAAKLPDLPVDTTAESATDETLEDIETEDA